MAPLILGRYHSLDYLWSGAYGDHTYDISLRSDLPKTCRFSQVLVTTCSGNGFATQISIIGSARISSAEEITAFLFTPKQFLIGPIPGHMICPSKVEKIDPKYRVGRWSLWFTLS